MSAQLGIAVTLTVVISETDSDWGDSARPTTGHAHILAQMFF